MKANTLFLDRDGVINKKADEHQYITNIFDFHFLDGVHEAIHILSRKFDRVIVISNQQGIAKGLMKDEDVIEIHKYMVGEINLSGGQIDAVYYCPHLEGTCLCRKPLPGMALKAKKDFPEIDLSTSFVVGDSESDMKFAENIGAARAIFLGRDDETLLDFARRFL